MRLEQVIINLLRNALDATKDRVRPASSTSSWPRGETAARLTVRDNGHGDCRYRSHLFEPFYTTKQRGRRRRAGAGHFLGDRRRTYGGQIDRPAMPIGGGAVFEMQHAPDRATKRRRRSEPMGTGHEDGHCRRRVRICVPVDQPMAGPVWAMTPKPMPAPKRRLRDSRRGLSGVSLISDIKMPGMDGIRRSLQRLMAIGFGACP